MGKVACISKIVEHFAALFLAPSTVLIRRHRITPPPYTKHVLIWPYVGSILNEMR